MVIYEGTTRREPRMDGSVVCLDNDDQETDNSLLDGDQLGKKSINPLEDTKDPEPSSNATDLSTHSQLAGNNDNVSSDSSESQRTPSKLPVS